MSSTFEIAVAAIIDAGRRLDARGWAMGGAGNYSIRLEDGTFAVTVTGRHKGHLEPADVMRVDAAGRSLDDKRPSAETRAHVAVYRARPIANAVLHTHSVSAVVLTRLDNEKISDTIQWPNFYHKLTKYKLFLHYDKTKYQQKLKSILVV
jgi:methylthioribulose-1-phosphate dehydratase